MPFIQLQFRRGVATQWTADNPILADGEMGLETDTRLFKIEQVLLVTQVLLVILERLDKQVPLAILDLLATRVKQALRVILVKQVLQVILATQERLVLLVIRVLQDLLATQEKQVPLVILVKLVLQVTLVKLVLLVIQV
jgi:hypothetical protein